MNTNTAIQINKLMYLIENKLIIIKILIFRQILYVNFFVIFGLIDVQQ